MTERLITSLTNDTVKAVRALHMRKERETTGTFLAEGLKFIGEALDQGRAPRLLLVGEDAPPHPILERARAVEHPPSCRARCRDGAVLTLQMPEVTDSPSPSRVARRPPARGMA